MSVYMAAILAAICLAAGIALIDRGRKNGKRAFILSGIAAVILCLGLLTYVGAALVLVSAVA